jgi:hypothetical protein
MSPRSRNFRTGTFCLHATVPGSGDLSWFTPSYYGRGGTTPMCLACSSAWATRPCALINRLIAATGCARGIEAESALDRLHKLSVLFHCRVPGHRSVIMLGVLVVVFRRDNVAGPGFFLGKREISLVASLRVWRGRHSASTALGGK